LVSPIQIREIDHLVLRVQDLEKSLKFYCEVLGCTEERRLDTLGLVQLRAGRGLIDLVPVQGELGRLGGAPAAEQGRNVDHLALRIEADDVAALLPFLDAQGIEYGPIERRYGSEGYGPSIYLKDPDGNVVELRGAPEAKP
jgi:catechol 2,3-dioxygenase-like lactoylglutathione lyase family enzyme